MLKRRTLKSAPAPVGGAAALALAAFLLAAPAFPAERALSTGQKLYVPAYSHIYHGVKTRRFELACTLSIRNTDLEKKIRIKRVDYYDDQGKLVKSFIKEPFSLNPLATREFVIEEKDSTGGSGANFIVEWDSPAPANPPVVETVMIGTASSQGISFTSRAVEIVDR